MLCSALLAFFAMQCSNPKNVQRMTSIDSLKQALDSSQALLKALPWDSIEDNSITTRENIAYIKQVYRDTMSKEEAEFLTKYYDANKGYSQLIMWKKQYESQLDFSRNQLNNLASDIENGLVDDDKFKEYFKSESEAVNRIALGVSGIRRVLDKVNPMFYASAPEVNGLVARLRQEDIEGQNSK